MPIVTKPNTFVANQIIDANQMNQNFDSIYGLVDGSLDAANLATNAINDSTKLANEIVIPSKSKGLIYGSDLFGQNWVVAGGLATFSGSPVNQIQVNTVSANILQVDGTYRHVSVAATSYTTSALNSTYYLDLQPDGTMSWATIHSTQTGYLPLASVTTNGSGNVLAITDVRVLSAGIAWINLSKVSSSLADLTVRSATDLNSGTLNAARLPTAIPATSIGNGDVTNAILSFINSLSSNAQTQIDAKIPLTQKGVSNGVASLDSGAKIPIAQLPDAVVGALEYQGAWNASTNSPTLTSSPTTIKGYYYVVSTAGTQFSISFDVGDWIVSNGTIWQKIDNTDAVSSFNGRLGAILPTTNDYTWAQIDKTTSSLADLTTRSASALNSGTLPVAQLPTAIPAINIGTGVVSNTEFGYLDGVTQPIQTQINGLEAQLTNVYYQGSISDGVTDNLAVFNAATALGKTVYIPKGNYYLSAATNYGVWMLDRGANIIGLSDISAPPNTMIDTSRLTGRVFDMNGKVGLNGFRLGSSIPWLEKTIRSYTEAISEVSIISSSGQIGLVTATRTSDNLAANMAGIGHASYGINDNTTNPETSWALYLESRRSIGAGSMYDVELDMVNYGNTVDFNPFSAITAGGGITANLWVSNGGGGVTGANNVSAAMVVLPNPALFRRGIVFVNGSLDATLQEALVLPPRYRIAWYESGGLATSLDAYTLTSTVKSNTSTDCYLSTISRSKADGVSPTTSLDTIHRYNYNGYNAGAYSVGFAQVLQRTNFASNQARFSYDIQMKGDAGVDHQVSLNGMGNASFSAYPDNVISLGTGATRWTTVYAGTGAINTSDQNLKQDIAAIDGALIDAFIAIEPKVFRFRDAVAEKGDQARIHMGYIAQDLERELSARGLDPARYAIWCKDEIMDFHKDSGTGVVTMTPTGTYRYGLRYEHFIALMEAANRKRFQDIEARLLALEQK